MPSASGVNLSIGWILPIKRPPSGVGNDDDDSSRVAIVAVSSAAHTAPLGAGAKAGKKAKNNGDSLRIVAWMDDLITTSSWWPSIGTIGDGSPGCLDDKLGVNLCVGLGK